jgi:hypothetical protein
VARAAGKPPEEVDVDAMLADAEDKLPPSALGGVRAVS